MYAYNPSSNTYALFDYLLLVLMFNFFSHVNFLKKIIFYFS